MTETLIIRIWQGQNRLADRCKPWNPVLGCSHVESRVPGGRGTNSSQSSLSTHSSAGMPEETPKFYLPPRGTFQDGYSPAYLSPPEEHLSPKSEPSPPRIVSEYDDSIRHFTASPDLLDPGAFALRTSSFCHERPRRPGNSLAPPSFPTWPMSSRVPSFASFTTEGGRTLSTRSSCSSLSEAFQGEQFESRPTVVDEDCPSPTSEHGCADCCAKAANCSKSDAGPEAPTVYSPWHPPQDCYAHPDKLVSIESVTTPLLG